MKQLILVVSFLTLAGGLTLHAQPGQQPEGKYRSNENLEMLPPEAQNLGILAGIEYPSWALRKNIQGEVKIRVQVDASGNYMTHEIMYTPDTELAQLVCQEIPNLQFAPGEIKKNPVEGWTAISVFFEISENARGRQGGTVSVGYQK